MVVTRDKQATRGTKQFWPGRLVQQETSKSKVVQTFVDPARFSKRAGSKIVEPRLSCLSIVEQACRVKQIQPLGPKNRGRRVVQRLAGSTYGLRDILRHSYRALAHARANVDAPARLYVPMMAATPPRWGTKWEVVRFSQAGRMPSQDVVLPLRSVVTFAFSSIGKFVLVCSLMCTGTCS